MRLLEKIENITALHESFQKLTESLESYSLVLLDADGNILTWNKGVEKIKGYKSDEIIGQHIRMFYTPQDREDKLPERLLDEARKNGVAKHVGRRVRKNGSIFWGSIEIAAIHDSKGDVIGFTKLARELDDELDILAFWFDNDGILHTKASPVPHTPEKIQEFRTILAAAVHGKKVCCVADVRDAILSEEGIEFSLVSAQKLYKAIAFVSNSKVDDNTRRLMSRMPRDIPTKAFLDHMEAKEWVKRYLRPDR